MSIKNDPDAGRDDRYARIVTHGCPGIGYEDACPHPDECSELGCARTMLGKVRRADLERDIERFITEEGME